LTRIDDSTIVTALNAAWAAHHPQDSTPLVAFGVDDDGMLIWLHDRSPQATTSFARNFLLGYSGTGNDISANPEPYHTSGLTKVYAGDAAAGYFNVQPGDPRVPDLLGVDAMGETLIAPERATPGWGADH
jgi:hypothetical protein